MTVTTGGAERQVVVVDVLVVGDVEHLLELDLLLLAGIDQLDLGADLVGEELDHLVAQRLGGRDHLAVLQQEADDVGRRAVQLRAELLGRRATLETMMPSGTGRVARRVGRQVHRLQLFAAATTTTLATGRTRAATGTTRHRGPPPGPPPGPPTGTAQRATGTAGTATAGTTGGTGPVR